MLIWVSNVVTFAVWYREIDSGTLAGHGVHPRAGEDFLIPQNQQGGREHTGWSPGLLDYLFVAFNTSMEFSPTARAVLIR
jgi:hypothetical protein